MGIFRMILGVRTFTQVNAKSAWNQKRDRGGCTALHIAANRGHAEVCRALMEHPTFTATETRNMGGQTAHEIAMQYNDLVTEDARVIESLRMLNVTARVIEDALCRRRAEGAM